MRKEDDRRLKANYFNRRDFLKAGFWTLAGLAALLPFRDLQHLNRVIKILQGQSIDCSYTTEAEFLVYPYDAIVVLGGGIGPDPNKIIAPNAFQKLRLEAGAIAYIKGLASKIVLLDGKIAPQIDPFIDRDYIQAEVNRLSQGKIKLPTASIVIEKTSINTASNMRELAKISERNDLSRILLITNQFHLQRAELHACAYNINATPRAAEDIIIDFDPTRAQTIQEFYATQPMNTLIDKERLGTVVTIYDPQGIVPTLAKEILNP